MRALTLGIFACAYQCWLAWSNPSLTGRELLIKRPVDYAVIAIMMCLALLSARDVNRKS